VVHSEGEALVDHCGRPYEGNTPYQDEEGSVLIAAGRKIALLDDRDLARYADRADELARIAKVEVAARFGFVQIPSVSLRLP
jgi:hypothetical protein